MKKRCAILVLALVAVAVLPGCCLRHDWQAVACEAPETCAKCGQTRGEILGHTWTGATCAVPDTCARCGQTQGERLDHQWREATCAAPATCAYCGQTEGEALPHQPEAGAGTVQCRWLEGASDPETGWVTRCSSCAEACWIPAEQLLPGSWAAERYVQGDEEERVGPYHAYVEFYEDNTFSLAENGTPLFGVWTLYETQPREVLDAAGYQARQDAGETVYSDVTFRLTFHSGAVMALTIQGENADACVLNTGSILCHMSRGRTVSPEETVAAKELAGKWELCAFVSEDQLLYKPGSVGMSGTLVCGENREVTFDLNTLTNHYHEVGRWIYAMEAPNPLSAEGTMHRYGVMLDVPYVLAVGMADSPELEGNLQPGIYCVLITSGDQYYFQRAE